ncbi:hypothetical protein [Flavobacterium reichenbachii]|uniref:Membrane protein n=1 Tax=Flavobacterium reichenbachii TaxID=362418 RepID=A0A085ZNH2_9FLAO|nr:hypothetical protein [Flavobacterium reichenbachii]KFF05986.1 membrane protein [Flavobacterium reichenbachii]OXB14787.1 hypothetical protein B0A68_12110 [Flavobacterium reichenbachii]
MNIRKSWIACCLFNFLTASLMGLMLRFQYIFPQHINYVFLLHAHSHTAMLGWVYMIIYALIVHFFIPKEKSQKPIYNQLFWLTEFCVAGMMISFPIQGYALYSIVFSTLHIFLSYIFCRLFWKDCFTLKKSSQKLLSASILFMLLSTLGVWFLGPAVGLAGKQSNVYQIAIQFFLHFQFNGWFIFAVLALFLYQFKYDFDKIKFNKFLYLLIISVFLTFAFPVGWFVDAVFLKWINGIGVVSYAAAFFYFYKMLEPQLFSFKESLDTPSKIAYGLALSSLFLKIMIQILVLIPNFAEASHQIRSFIIGFIHLTTLGVLTGFLFGVLIQNKIISNHSFMLRFGIISFFFGYIITEVLLLLQGIFLYLKKDIFPQYYVSIFAGSILITLGLLLILTSVLKTKKQE